MFRNYFKTAFRNIWRNKTFSLLNIFGLAIGVSCAAFIFLWIEDEINFDSFNEKKDVLFQVYQNQTYDGKTSTINATPGVLSQALKDEIPGIKNTCRATWPQNALLSLDDKDIYQSGLYADSSIFSMFTLPFLEGSPNTAFIQPHSLVITNKMARIFFGSSLSVVGKTLRLNHKDDYLITGVIKDLPENSTIQFSWLASFKIFENQNTWLKYWASNGVQTFVELEPHASPTTINNKINGFLQSKDKSAVGKPFLLSMKDWRLHSDFESGQQVGGRIKNVKLFSTIAWIILLIACINFMNLATARYAKRAREVGVRKVLGAGKGLLIIQFLSEAILMSFISVFLGIAITYLLLPSFNELVEKNLHIQLQNPLHLEILCCVALVCGLIAGSYPALYLSSFNPISVLKRIDIKTNGAVFVRKVLVVLQFSLSIIFIVSTIVIYLQMKYVKIRPLGYKKENLLEVDLTGDLKKNFEPIRNELLNSGKVENTALSMSDVLWMGSTTTDLKWPNKDQTKKVPITQNWISAEYVATTKMKIVAGRDFSTSDSLNVIVNESFAKLMDNGGVIGKTILRGRKKYTVIGEVNDPIYGDMYGSGGPMIFLSYPDYYNYMFLRLKDNPNLQQSLSVIQSTLKKYNPGYPVEIKFVDKEFDRIFENENLTSSLSKIFTSLAILISCLGLFGLASYSAERRTKEIGIRKVLGASVKGLLALLSANFLKLVFISLVIAAPISWWLMNKWLQDYAYRIEIHWWIFAIAGVIAIGIALCTISIQSVKAAITNPVKSLRAE